MLRAVMQPADQAARERARDEHATSLVLEAGAGTGKTTLLIDRIEALVRAGRATLENIAAVTFTENAAATMKLRLRERLEQARARRDLPPAERTRAAAALDMLERAAICTIHALCAAILQERPLECGVLPGFRVADEAETDALFALAWDEWLGEALVRGDELVLEALDAGIPLEGVGSYGERTSLRGLARALIEQRDLHALVAESDADPVAWRATLLERTAPLPALLAGVSAVDTLGARLHALAAAAETSRGLEGRALRAHLLALQPIPHTFGSRQRWPTPEALAQGRQVAEWTKTAMAAWNADAAASLHARLVRAVAGVAQSYERRKLAAGVLDFLDLLMCTRAALRDSPALLRALRERFRVVIVDEFQDTDPLQAEILERLAGDAPGALTVVGDAKQSIYRFRRAEVALFREVARRARARPGHAVLPLTQNFRSRPAILRFVNRVFSELIQESVEAGQPAYEALQAPAGLSEDAVVIALRFEAPLAEGDELLQAEARALALYLAHVAAGGVRVRDPGGEERPSRAGDVLVLARRLTQVKHLEVALEAAGLRFAVEGGKSFFDRQEVHEILAVLRALDDPSDRVSLVAALRSTFLGVSDRDIVSYALAGGRLDLRTPVEEERAGGLALAPALRLLDDLHRQRTDLSVAALIERLYDETRIAAALTGSRRGEAQIANLDKVVALARQAAGLGVLSLRGFTTLLAERIVSAREEPDLPATRPGDPETVRVLSIHKAKGLEAPLVALFDSADDPRPRAEAIPLWAEGRIALGFREGCQPPRWDELRKPEEARAWGELRRLLYVACTRARDLLVIPQPPSDARVGGFWRELQRFLPSGGASDPDVQVLDAASLPEPAPASARADLRGLAAAEGGDALAVRWDAQRAALLVSAARREPLPISVTRLAARDAPPFAVSVPLPTAADDSHAPVEPRVGGRNFGALVHRVLEWLPLDEPQRAHGMALALAPRFGLDEASAQRAGELVVGTLALPVMQRARQAAHAWRELPLCFPLDEELVEGKVDLVFEEDGQLVVVDYKTDQIGAAQAIDQAAHHAPQLRLYGRGLTLATGLHVKERLVLFTALGRAVPV